MFRKTRKKIKYALKARLPGYSGFLCYIIVYQTIWAIIELLGYITGKQRIIDLVIYVVLIAFNTFYLKEMTKSKFPFRGKLY